MLGPQSGFHRLGESSQAKRCKSSPSEVNQCSLKWKGCETGTDNMLYIPLKQAKQPSSPRAPHTIKCTSIYPASDAKDFTVFLDMFFGLEFCFVLCVFVLAHIQSNPKSHKFYLQNISRILLLITISITIFHWISSIAS